MKLLCPHCQAGQEISGASRYNVFACDSCHYHFRGTHAEIAKWNRLFKQLFTFDTTTSYADRTPCPHCCGWVPVYTGDDGLTCMYCGKGIRTSRVVNFTNAEIVELQQDFKLAELTPDKEHQLRAMLRDFDWHPRDRNELERLLREFRSTPAIAPAAPLVEQRRFEPAPTPFAVKLDPLPEVPPPPVAPLERTTKYVLLKVHVLHPSGVDPEVICEQATFGYDYEDGAVEGAEVVGVFGVGEIAPASPKVSPAITVSANRVAALVEMMKHHQ